MKITCNLDFQIILVIDNNNRLHYFTFNLFTFHKIQGVPV